MTGYTRRDMLRLGATLAGASSVSGGVFAAGLQKLFSQQAKVLWLQGMSCSGCSVSFLNTDQPTIAEVLVEIVSLIHHPNVGAAQGDDCMRVIDDAVRRGDYVLVLEGAVPLDMPEACVIGGRPLTSLLPPLLRKAQGIISAGTCAAFGGIPQAEGNPTGAASLLDFMRLEHIPWKNRLINCPGCPVHPQSLLGTAAYFIAAGYPKVDDALLTPDMFYKHSVHDECPRFHYWEKQAFAEKFGEEGCLFKLGCLGPLSHTNCPRRQWNGGVNWCIRAGAPCIGCTSENFARKTDFPLYRKSEAVRDVAYHEDDRKGSQA